MFSMFVVLLFLAVGSTQATDEDDDVKATIKDDLLGDILLLSESINSDGLALRDLVEEVKDSQTDDEDFCKNLTQTLVAAGEFVSAATGEVSVMVANTSLLVDELIDCFHDNDTGIDFVLGDGPAAPCSDPDSAANDTVCDLNALVACMGRPVSDGLDCLDKRLAQLEEMRKEYTEEIEDLGKETKVQVKEVYRQVKECLLNPPTLPPQPGSAPLHTLTLSLVPMLIIHAL